MPPRLALLVFVTLVGAAPVLLEGCGGSGENSALASVTPARSEVVEVRDIAYGVSRIEVSKGEVIDLELRSAGMLLHDLTVDVMPVEKLVIGQNAGIHIGHLSRFALHAGPEIGDTVTLRIRPTKSGTYTYYCATEGHRDAGMTGTIVVR